MTGSAHWGIGAPEPDRLPPRPALSFSQPAVRPAWAAAARRLLTGQPALRRAARALAPRELLRWLLLQPTFAYHGCEQTVTWSGIELPALAVPRPFRPGRQAITGVVIAKDEQDRLGDALASLAPLVDEVVVVVDAGSRDGTTDVARAAGARVLHRAFDRFDHQRNAGLELVRTPWAFALDCDERVRPQAVPLILEATQSTTDEVYLNILSLVGDDPRPTEWPGDAARLFRSHLRFSRALHETLPSRSVLRMPLDVAHVAHWKSQANALENEIRYRTMQDPQDPLLAGFVERLAREPVGADRNVPRALWS